jgi:hypothetical protein
MWIMYLDDRQTTMLDGVFDKTDMIVKSQAKQARRGKLTRYGELFSSCLRRDVRLAILLREDKCTL